MPVSAREGSCSQGRAIPFLEECRSAFWVGAWVEEGGLTSLKIGSWGQGLNTVVAFVLGICRPDGLQYF